MLDRRSYLGCSDLGVLTGLSPFKTPYELFVEKTADGPALRTSTLPQEVGTALEPLVLAKYQERTGRTLVRRAARIDDPPLMHPRINFLGCHPDAEVVGERRGVEAKTCGWRSADRFGEEGSDEIPPEYLAQVTGTMACLDLDVMDVPVLFLGSNRFTIYEVRRDLEFEKTLLDLAGRFWRRVQDRDPPAIDSPEVAQRYLARRHPRVMQANLLPSTPDVDGWAARLAQAKAELARWEEEEELAKAHLKAAIGDAKGIAGPWGQATWTDTRGKEALNVEQLCADLQISPDDIAKHTHRGAGYRALRFTPKEKTR